MTIENIHHSFFRSYKPTYQDFFFFEKNGLTYRGLVVNQPIRTPRGLQVPNPERPCRTSKLWCEHFTWEFSSNELLLLNHGSIKLDLYDIMNIKHFWLWMNCFRNYENKVQIFAANQHIDAESNTNNYWINLGTIEKVFGITQPLFYMFM